VESTESRSSRKERTRRSRRSRSGPGSVPRASGFPRPGGRRPRATGRAPPPRGAGPPSFPRTPSRGRRGQREPGIPVPHRVEGGFRDEAEPLDHRQQAVPRTARPRRGPLTSRASSRARPRETVTPKKTEAVSSTPCASSNTTASTRGSTSPNRPSSPRAGPSRSRSARSRRTGDGFTTTRSASAARPPGGSEVASLGLPHADGSHISLRALTSPQTRASSGTPAHSETSPVRVVSANACIAGSSRPPGRTRTAARNGTSSSGAGRGSCRAPFRTAHEKGYWRTSRTRGNVVFHQLLLEGARAGETIVFRPERIAGRDRPASADPGGRLGDQHAGRFERLRPRERHPELPRPRLEPPHRACDRSAGGEGEPTFRARSPGIPPSLWSRGDGHEVPELYLKEGNLPAHLAGRGELERSRHAGEILQTGDPPASPPRTDSRARLERKHLQEEERPVVPHRLEPGGGNPHRRLELLPEPVAPVPRDRLGVVHREHRPGDGTPAFRSSSSSFHPENPASGR